MKITTTTGLVGVGSGAPVEYVTGETQDTVVRLLTELSSRFIQQPFDRLQSLYTTLDGALDRQPAALASLEMAFYDLWAKRWNIPLWQHFGGTVPELITDMTIPIVGADEATSLVCEAVSVGFDLFKIKIGDSEGHEADLARIAAVANAAPHCHLRIDANQAFEPDAAVSFVAAAQRISDHIQLVEQPVAKEDIEGLKYVKDHIDLPVFADESARSYDEVKRLIERGAVDGVNIKLMKTGIREAEDIARLCKKSGISLMVGCMLESPLGIAAASAMVAGIGGFDYIDLDSHKLLKPVKSLSGAFKTDGPRLILDDQAPGWGIDHT